MPTPLASTGLSLFQAFLSAQANANGGEHLYNLYAATAIILFDGQLLPREQVSRSDYTAAHQQNVIRSSSFPVFLEASLLSVHSEQDLAVVWLQLKELTDQRTITAALGMVNEAGEWKIGWCVIAASEAHWTYRQGLLQALAEYPWLLSTDPLTPRSSLDASYFRWYRQPEMRLLTLPDARFACHSNTTCCRTDYAIALPSAAQILIDAMPWDEIRPALNGTRLAQRNDGQLQLKDNNEACRFLDENDQCLIHKTLGRQPFAPCAAFPFFFAETPDGIAVSNSFICRSVRNRCGSLLPEREADLRERFFLAPKRAPDGFRLAPHMGNIPWELFRDIESALLEFLDMEELSLYRRLYLGNRYLAALRSGAALDMSGWANEAAEQLSIEFWQALRTFLSNILKWDRTGLKPLADMPVPDDLLHNDLHDTPILANLLKNLLFSKVYSYSYDLSTAHNMAILTYLLALIMQRHSDGPLSDELWQELSAIGNHGLLRSLLPDDVPQGLAEFLGSSEFGQWALWYPAEESL